MILPPPFPASSTTPDHRGGTACLSANVPYRITLVYGHQRQACTIKPHLVNIYRVIRS